MYTHPEESAQNFQQRGLPEDAGARARFATCRWFSIVKYEVSRAKQFKIIRKDKHTLFCRRRMVRNRNQGI